MTEVILRKVLKINWKVLALRTIYSSGDKIIWVNIIHHIPPLLKILQQLPVPFRRKSEFPHLTNRPCCCLFSDHCSSFSECYLLLHFILEPTAFLDLGMQNPRSSYNSFLLECFSSNSIWQVLCYLSGPNLNGRILISS